MKLQLCFLPILFNVSLLLGMSLFDLPLNKTVKLAHALQEGDPVAFRALGRSFNDPVSRHQEIANAVILMAARCPERLAESMNLVLDNAPEAFEVIPACFSPSKTKIKKSLFVNELVTDADRLRNFITAYLRARLSRQVSNQFNDIIHHKGDLSEHDVRLCKRFLHVSSGNIVPEDIVTCFNEAASTVEHDCDTARGKVLKHYVETVASMPEGFSDTRRALLKDSAHLPAFYFMDGNNQLFSNIIEQVFSPEEVLDIFLTCQVGDLVQRMPTATDRQKANFVALLSYCCTTSTADGRYALVSLYTKWLAFSVSTSSCDPSITQFIDDCMSQVLDRVSNESNAYLCLKQCLAIMAASMDYDLNNPIVRQVVLAAERNAESTLVNFIIGRPSAIEDLKAFMRELSAEQLKVFFNLVNQQDVFYIFIKAFFAHNWLSLPGESFLLIQSRLSAIEALPHQATDASESDSIDLDYDQIICSLIRIIESFSGRSIDHRSLEWKVLVVSLNHSFEFIEKQLLRALHRGSARDAEQAVHLLSRAIILLRSGQFDVSHAILPICVSMADTLLHYIVTFGPDLTFRAYLPLSDLLGLCAFFYTHDYKPALEDHLREYRKAAALLPEVIHNFSSCIVAHPRTRHLNQRLLFALVEDVQNDEKSIRAFMRLLAPQGIDFRACGLAHLFFPCFNSAEQPFAFDCSIENHHDARYVIKINQIAQVLETHMREFAICTAHGVLHYTLSNPYMGLDLKLRLINSLRPEFASEVLNLDCEDVFLLSILRTPDQLALLPSLVALGAHLNVQDRRGTSLLMQCASLANVAMIEWLIQQGVDLSLVDNQDCTVVDYIAHADCSLADKETMLSAVLRVDQSLCNRRSSSGGMTPLMNYIVSIIEGQMRPSSENAHDTVALLIRYGALVSTQNDNGSNAIDFAYNASRFGINLNFLGDLMSAVLYEGPAHATDPYQQQHEAMAIATQRCADVENIELVDQVRERLNALYVRHYSRLRRSVIEQEIDAVLSALAANSTSGLDPQRLIDINGNGFYATYDSYRQLCLRGALNEVLRQEVDRSAMREIPSLARYILELLERRTARVHHELTFSDYPGTDMITCEGFIISRDSFYELLAVTSKTSVSAVLAQAYSAEAELERLCLLSDMDHDDLQETLELWRSGRVNLKTVHDLVDFLKSTHAQSLLK